ncbi:50S ribosomal protein L19e [Candidatus Bathyarchaeota archaeon]|nr:MAG: 50S ribosomal protein L19e [Candidatus Bathyarchaeota archaeon]
MLKLTNQKRLAADIMKIGKSRVWINPERVEDVEEVITRAEIRGLINDGVIQALPQKGISRGRARIRHLQKKKGRRRGHGSRSGGKTSLLSKKKRWAIKIRAIRKRLKVLVDSRVIQRSTYRRLYLLSKGGVFDNVRQVEQYIEANQLARRRSIG